MMRRDLLTVHGEAPRSPSAERSIRGGGHSVDGLLGACCEALWTEGLPAREPPGHCRPGACGSPLREALGMRSPARRSRRGLLGPVRRGPLPRMPPSGRCRNCCASRWLPAALTPKLLSVVGLNPARLQLPRAPLNGLLSGAPPERLLAAASPRGSPPERSRLRSAGAGVGGSLAGRPTGAGWEGCRLLECSWEALGPGRLGPPLERRGQVRPGRS